MAILLHLQRLPLYDGGHRALDTRFLAHDPVNLFWLAIAERGKQHQMSGNTQNCERNQSSPASLVPFPNQLTDEYCKCECRGKCCGTCTPLARSPGGMFKDMSAYGQSHDHNGHEDAYPIKRDCHCSLPSDQQIGRASCR